MLPTPCCRCHRSIVTSTQLVGYGIAFLGVCYYNYKKVQAMAQASTGAEKAPEKAEKMALLENGRQGEE